jgi:uncharacterized membrane protein YjgN (DUF898 family)
MTDKPNEDANQPNDDELKWAPPEYRPAPPTGEVAPPPLPATFGNVPETYQMAFRGTAGEYFRIWIVNLFLSIITLGFYFPWAIVRQRKYIYANLWVGEDNFGFHANPLALLKGYLIVLVGVVLYGVGGYFNEFVPLIMLVIFALCFPFLVWKAIRFRARNSSYRNIRFNFQGELSQAYVRYLCWALLIPFTFGLIIPYMAYLKKDYLLNFMYFGDRKFNFQGESGKFYPPYLIAMGIGFTAYILFIIPMFIAIPLGEALELPENTKAILFISVLAVGYLILLFAAAIAKALVFAKIQNYVWSGTKLGEGILFQSVYEVWPLAKIEITNGLAIFFSLGLALPWATVRKINYLAERTFVTMDKNQLDQIAQSSLENESALGDAAADYLDFDLG